MDKQKAKFNGAPNQMFTIGRSVFPTGVWKFITPDELGQLSTGGAYLLFDFNPPVRRINFSLTDTEIKEDLPVKKAKKRKTKTKKEEGDL